MSTLNSSFLRVLVCLPVHSCVLFFICRRMFLLVLCVYLFVNRRRHHHHNNRVESVRVVWSEPSPPPDVTTNPELFDHPRPVRIQRHPTTSINNRLVRVVFWVNENRDCFTALLLGQTLRAGVLVYY